MPGGGEKYFCTINDEKIPVPKLYQMKAVEYIEHIVLTNENIDILYQKGEYFFIVDERIVRFANNTFYLQNRPISIDTAYSIGGLHILKRV